MFWGGEAREVRPGEVLITGSEQGTSGYRIAYVTKLAPDGSSRRTALLSASEDLTLSSTAATADGGYLSLGSIGDHFWLVRLGSDLTVLSEKLYPNVSAGKTVRIEPTSDGGFAVYASTYQTDRRWDLLVLQLDANGNFSGCPPTTHSSQADYVDAAVQPRTVVVYDPFIAQVPTNRDPAATSTPPLNVCGP